jgi:hypothetical protein
MLVEPHIVQKRLTLKTPITPLLAKLSSSVSGKVYETNYDARQALHRGLARRPAPDSGYPPK